MGGGTREREMYDEEGEAVVDGSKDDGGLTKRILLARSLARGASLAGLNTGGTGGTGGGTLLLLLAAGSTAESALSLLEEIHGEIEVSRMG